MTTLHFVNLCQVLQIPPTADLDAVRAAVTKQRRQWVKRQTSADPERRAEAEARVRDIDRAEKVLLSSSSRAEFGKALAAHEPPAAVRLGAEDASWLERAKSYLAAENPGAANYAARESINQQGSDAEAWFVRAHSSFLLGDDRDAEYEFTEAIRLRPDNALYHYGFGETFAAQEKWKSALGEYEQALRLDPGNPEYRTSIALVYLHHEIPAKAVEIMEALVNEHPGDQVFMFYLAIALHDNALDSLGHASPMAYGGDTVHEGGFVVVSEAQADWLEKQTKRIRSLQVADPDIAKMVGELEQLVTKARTVRWNLDDSLPWFTAFIVLGIIPFFSGFAGSGGAVLFGLFAGGVITTIFVTTRRLPGWKHLLRALTLSGRLQRTGI